VTSGEDHPPPLGTCPAEEGYSSSRLALHDEQDGKQTPDGYDHAAPPAIAPPPTDHPLPAEREETQVKENGQAHAEQDAEHYPEQATPTQR
jgi:hypothetical protein